MSEQQKIKQTEVMLYIVISVVVTVIILGSFFLGRLSKSYTDKANFTVECMSGDLVKITSNPDGNYWTTTKDSIFVYIENY